MTSLIQVRTLSTSIEITVDEYDSAPVVYVENLITLNLTWFWEGLIFKPGAPTVGVILSTGTGLNVYQTSVGPSLILGRCYQVEWVTGAVPTTYSISPQNNAANALHFHYGIIVSALQMFTQRLPDPEQFTSNLSPIVPFVPRPCYLTYTGLAPELVMYSATPCCITEDTLVQTQRGILAASEVKPGDLVQDYNGSSVQIKRNARFSIATRDFVQLSLESGQSLLIKGKHVILEDGREIAAEDSKFASQVLLTTPKIVHTFLTENRTFINISGFSVGTWSEEAFDNFVAEDAYGRIMQFKYVE